MAKLTSLFTRPSQGCGALRPGRPILAAMTDRDVARRVLRALSHSPVGATAVLVGSSGLFGFDTEVPALTEDVDVCVPELLVGAHGDAIIAALAQRGFVHEPGTATFLSADGVVFDLLGHGDPLAGDHIGGTGRLRVMVFEDLSRIIGAADATISVADVGRALTPLGLLSLPRRGSPGPRPSRCAGCSSAWSVG